MRRLASLAAVLAIVPACYHVELAPVSANAPARARIEAYNRLEAAAQNHTVSVYASKDGVSVVESDELVLRSGDTIVFPEDLLPVVEPSSAAARAAHRSADARDNVRLAWAGFAASFLVGSVLMLDATNHDGPDGLPEIDGGEAGAGAAVMLVGGIASAGFAMYYAHVAGQERRAAFATYDDGLRAQLALCANGLDLVPCEQLTPPAPAPAPIAPPSAAPIAPPSAAPIAPAPPAPMPAAAAQP